MAVLLRGFSLVSSFGRSRVRYSCTVITKTYSMACKGFADYIITPNLRLNTVDPIEFEPKKSGRLPKIVGNDCSRPLLVLLEYMNAKEKHVQKFVTFYLNYGFDVLRIHLSPWQLLWPVKGSQVGNNDFEVLTI